MIAIDDPDLPGLSSLDTAALRRITGTKDVSVMRFRYRSGKRAILHLSTDDGEGSAWFFQGDKAKRLARRYKRWARYDARSEALYETFPNDHRMPQIRAFLDEYDRVAPDLIGGEPSGPPALLRYRPGLSCTFRCRRRDRTVIYVKLINEDNPTRLVRMNRRMMSCLAGSPVSVAPVVGSAPDFDAIAYGAASGRPLDAELVEKGDMRAVRQAIEALRLFWSLKLIPRRQLTAATLRDRAAESVSVTCAAVPAAERALSRMMARVGTCPPQLVLLPIHADVKLEHLFMNGRQTTLIDTESVSLGPPDYDLAQLYGRLWQAELEGHLPHTLVQEAAAKVRAEAGDSFDWCLDVVALRLAKFYAQRPTPDAAAKIDAILERLS